MGCTGFQLQFVVTPKHTPGLASSRPENSCWFYIRISTCFFPAKTQDFESSISYSADTMISMLFISVDSFQSTAWLPEGNDCCVLEHLHSLIFHRSVYAVAFLLSKGISEKQAFVLKEFYHHTSDRTRFHDHTSPLFSVSLWGGHSMECSFSTSKLQNKIPTRKQLLT